MKISRHAVAIVAALTIAGAAAPSQAFQMAVNQVQPINAEFVPTREQVGSELNNLNRILEADRLASFSSGEASTEYIEARRYYQVGRYDEALSHARRAEQALPNVPNWVTPDTVLR